MNNSMNNNTPKIKLFFGNVFGTRVDEEFGEWIEEHPRVKILDFRYEYSGSGEHSIAILYEE